MSSKVQERIARKMVLAASQKGGCGKSFVVRCLVQIGRSRGHGIAAYDGDAQVGTTYRALGTRDEKGGLLPMQDPLVGSGKYSLRDDGQRKEILNTLENWASSSIHDLPGGSLNDLLKVQDEGLTSFENFLSVLDLCDCSLTLLHLVTDEISTIHSVRQYIEAFGGSARHVVFLNRAFMGGGGFSHWDGSKTRKKFLENGGAEVALPALKPAVRDKIDEMHLPITAGFLQGGLTIDESGHLLRFRRELEEQLVRVQEWIF